MKQDGILTHLGRHPWSGNILLYDEVGSTNTLLKSLGQQGAPHGTVIIADHQTAGRGRMGRSFLSPVGVGVYLSALIRLEAAPTQIMHLTCAAAVAMCDAVQAVSGIRPKVKWINDLVVGKQKLGGILTELVIDPQSKNVDFAIVGIGINCNQVYRDFDPSIQDMATSLRLATGQIIDRELLCAEMIRALERMSTALLTNKDELMQQYAEDCITIGRKIQVLGGNSIRYGTAVGIDEDGGLIVTLESGETQTVSSGEVSVRGMYGYI